MTSPDPRINAADGVLGVGTADDQVEYIQRRTERLFKVVIALVTLVLGCVLAAIFRQW